MYKLVSELLVAYFSTNKFGISTFSYTFIEKPHFEQFVNIVVRILCISCIVFPLRGHLYSLFQGQCVRVKDTCQDVPFIYPEKYFPFSRFSLIFCIKKLENFRSSLAGNRNFFWCSRKVH